MIKDKFDTMEYGPAPESDKEAKAFLAVHKGKFGHFIGGKMTAHQAKDGFDSFNPANGQKLARLSQANNKDVDAAVAAAKKAQPKWEKAGGKARARFLYAIARLVQKHARLFAVLESMDNGKPIRESRDIDIPLVARHFYHHAGWAQLTEAEFADHKSIGVVGQIIPWNFPLLMLAWKIAPALAMGNCVVLKPAEYTSLTALLFARICVEAGLPDGVVNIITGDGRTGQMLVDHDGVDKIAFTGSTEIGRLIRQRTARTGKKLTLELGGKSPFIVFDDADLDSAVEGLVDAIWFNQGEVCCAGSRLLIQESISEKFIKKLEVRMKKLHLGDPLDKCTDIGAVVDKSQIARIEKLVEAGKKDGKKIIQPKQKITKQIAKGCFYPPTLITDVPPSSVLAQEEIFGPVLVSMRFRTPDEAVALANNTAYGLAASIWSENINLALDVAPKIRAGVVWINSTNQFDAAAGFGGVKQSGFGREGGREGLYEYIIPKAGSGKIKPVKINAGKTISAKTGAVKTIALEAIDRTAKLFIGGKQARPDGGYATEVVSPKGILLGHVGKGNRKDIRNGVEAAVKAAGWASASGHLRAQILYYIAENLSARAGEFAARLSAMTGATKTMAGKEVAAAIDRLFTYAAWADKYDGKVHSVPMRGVTLAMNEPVGVIGIAAPDEAPLLGFISLIAPAIALGNRIVVIPSERHPLAATDFYQVLETSDLPAGVVNIVTGERDELVKTLAEHYEVDAVWYFGPHQGAEMVKTASAGNLKRVFAPYDGLRNWYDETEGAGEEFLRQASQIKNIWIPYGE